MAGHSETLEFGSSCTLPQAEALRARLLDRLRESTAKSLLLDLGDVEEADVSLVQILISLGKSASDRGIDVAAKTSSTVDDLLAKAGLAGWPEA